MRIQNKIAENVSFQCFTQKNAETDANQPILTNRKTLPKRYILSVFVLVTYKKRENLCKALNIRKQKDFERKVYNEFFYSSNEPKGKKTQKLVDMEQVPSYQNAETYK